MADDPLSGHKATFDFLSTMFVSENAEVEKADGEGLSPQAKDLYDSCVAGGAEAGADSAETQQSCTLLAQDFDRRHPGGLSFPDTEVSTPDEGGVVKTISTAGMAADLGEPSATVELTDVPGRKKRRLPVC